MLNGYRARYPVNWPDLALACKERAGWRCEECLVKQHSIRVSRRGTPYFIYLHAAHINDDPENPAPELRCLCISCHARYDYQRKERAAALRLEILKHLKLLVDQGIVTIQEM